MGATKRTGKRTVERTAKKKYVRTAKMTGIQEGQLKDRLKDWRAGLVAVLHQASSAHLKQNAFVTV